MTMPLTPARKKILQSIGRLIRERGGATPHDVAESLGVTRQNVASHVQFLRQTGYLEAPLSRNAPLLLTPRGQRATGGSYGYPLLGEVAAGPGTFADDAVQAVIARIDAILPLHEGDYLLRVQGESMIGLGIYPGDTIAVRPSDTCEDGEIAVVLLPGEDTATLKRIYRHGPEIELVSENPEYPPRRYPAEDVRIRGCLVGHIGDIRARRR